VAFIAGAQAAPQAPQFALSFCESTHVRPQARSPLVHIAPLAAPSFGGGDDGLVGVGGFVLDGGLEASGGGIDVVVGSGAVELGSGVVEAGSGVVAPGSGTVEVGSGDVSPGSGDPRPRPPSGSDLPSCTQVLVGKSQK
jgi:hypothetical protein